MVKLSLLFTVLLLVISSWSSPIPSAKCSPTISIGIEKIFIGDILKNHKCKATEQFMVLYTEEEIFNEEVLHNDKAQSVCAGLSSLVLYGEKHQMFDKVCKDATFTETEDFCKVFLHNKMKELARQSLSSGLPATYINALQSLDEATCNAACGGLKSEMCSMLVQLGQAFVSVSSDKGSNVLEEKSGNKDTVKDKEPITSSKTFVNKTGSSFHYIKARENGSRKISQSDSNVAPDQHTTGQRGPNNKGQGPKYLGQRQGPSYQQGGQKQSPYYPNQGRQGWNQNQGGPSYQQGGQRQPSYYPNQGRQGWNQNQGGPSYQQGGQRQPPSNPNQGRQGWNQNQGGPSYQQRGQKQFPYNSNQGRQGWNQNQGAQRQPPSNPNQGIQGWNQNGGPYYQQRGQKQFPYNSNQGRQGWNQNQGGPSYQQGGQRQPPSNPDQGRQGWKNTIQNQGGPKEPLSNPNQVGKDSKTSQENRQNSNQDKNPGFLDQTNNVPSGDVKTTNNSINGSNNKNNSIEPPTLSKTSSPLNTTNNTVGQTKPEKNKDANLGEAPEVTDGPKEPVNPFDLGLSDKGNAPHNMNDDHLWDDKPGPGEGNIPPVDDNKPKAQPTTQVITTKPTTASQDVIVDEEETYHGYGTWHFITIFLLFAVIVVVAYFLIHNRKKLREGVSGYVSGKNRTRRLREYRPLSQQ